MAIFLAVHGAVKSGPQQYEKNLQDSRDTAATTRSSELPAARIKYKRMLTLIAAPYEVTVADEPTYTPGSADNQHTYSHAYYLGPDSYGTSQHSVRVFDADGPVASCILTAGDGASGIHDHTALIFESTCFVAVGPFIASLALPTLELNWAVRTDDATCFGIHKPPNHNCLISHGELVIARLTLTGTIKWQAGGADIFSEGCTVHENSVEAVDFNGRKYRFDIESGRESAT